MNASESDTLSNNSIALVQFVVVVAHIWLPFGVDHPILVQIRNTFAITFKQITSIF